MRKLRSEENDHLDLEAYIMKAWQTSDDLTAIMHAMEYLNEDDQANAILGVYTLHEIRMKDLWRVFEQYLDYNKTKQDIIS